MEISEIITVTISLILNWKAMQIIKVKSIKYLNNFRLFLSVVKK